MNEKALEYFEDDNICPKCKGQGRLIEYMHNQKGVCFRCWGSGLNKKPIQSKKYVSKERMEEILGFKIDSSKRVGSWQELKKLIKEGKNEDKESEI
jgi:hypothetical protein